MIKGPQSDLDNSSQTDLMLCYDGIKRIAPYLDLDSFEVVKEVDRYREFWRPEKPHVILVAESHVHTCNQDFAHRWSYPEGGEYHGNLVRFV